MVSIRPLYQKPTAGMAVTPSSRALACPSSVLPSITNILAKDASPRSRSCVTCFATNAAAGDALWLKHATTNSWLAGPLWDGQTGKPFGDTPML